MDTRLPNLYNNLTAAKKRGEKRLAILLDPDKLPRERLTRTISLAVESGVHYFFIGGSLLVNNLLDDILEHIRDACDIPLVIFPGNSFQLSYRADAILFLSLISGRNPELLIGQHVIAAPFLKISPLEVIPCGYMLVDGGVRTAVQYMSNTNPIPDNKPDIAAGTALAGELLGLKTIYLEAGSGALHPVPAEMIQAVSGTVSVPLIVGGGIRNADHARTAWNAGADLIVVGNAIEQDPDAIRRILNL
jgi:phosphoglycerol geranylgeranyltransferase